MDHFPPPRHWRALLHPMNLAGLFTWLAVAFTLQYGPPAQLGLRWMLATAFLFAFFGEEWVRRHSLAHMLLVVVQAVSALALIGLASNIGVAPVLLVMLVGSMATCWPPRGVLAAAMALNFAMFLLLRARGHEHALTVVSIYAAFQLFAALTAHYARTAEDARDQLAWVNADLLATRALLADAARDGERIRVARELHDVSGHKLTALKLNLRALASAADASPQLKLAEQLSSELLQDIRSVVHALRDIDGLNIASALQALGAPMPRPRLQVTVEDDVHITDPATAETVLRVVQEALTNAARHADADTVFVRVSRAGGALHLHIEDDGQLRDPLREGHGIAGMRERVAERGGCIAFKRGERGGLCIRVELPA